MKYREVSTQDRTTVSLAVSDTSEGLVSITVHSPHEVEMFVLSARDALVVGRALVDLAGKLSRQSSSLDTNVNSDKLGLGG